MANTRQTLEGNPIGDPDGDLDYISRGAHDIGVIATGNEFIDLDREDKFMEKFTWVPHWQAEATTAVKGLRPAINEADHHANLSGVESVLANARGYKLEAGHDLTYLESVLDNSRDENTLNIGSVRKDTRVLEVLAKHQLFASALVQHKWPGHKKDNRAKRIHASMDTISSLGDEDLEMLWRGARVSSVKRYTFWHDQLQEVNQHPRVRASQREVQQHVMSRSLLR